MRCWHSCLRCLPAKKPSSGHRRIGLGGFSESFGCQCPWWCWFWSYQRIRQAVFVWQQCVWHLHRWKECGRQFFWNRSSSIPDNWCTPLSDAPLFVCCCSCRACVTQRFSPLGVCLKFFQLSAEPFLDWRRRCLSGWLRRRRNLCVTVFEWRSVHGCSGVFGFFCRKRCQNIRNCLWLWWRRADSAWN